jgi:hypothetical protein
MDDPLLTNGYRDNSIRPIMERCVQPNSMGGPWQANSALDLWQSLMPNQDNEYAAWTVAADAAVRK